MKDRLTTSGLCNVLLDSVLHSGHVAAIHAEQAHCFQCREFMHKFRVDLSHMASKTATVRSTVGGANTATAARMVGGKPGSTAGGGAAGEYFDLHVS